MSAAEHAAEPGTRVPATPPSHSPAQDFVQAGDVIDGASLPKDLASFLRRVERDLPERKARERQREALSKAPSTREEPTEECGICSGVGWIFQRDGRVRHCPHVEREISRGRLARAQGISGISRRHARCSFDSFVFASEAASEAASPSIVRIETFSAVQEWAAAYFDQYASGSDAAAEGDGLFLHGPTGTGKTHLAYAAINALLLEPEMVGSVLAVTGTDLLHHIRAAFDGDAETTQRADDLLNAAKTAPLLLLDDLGAPKPSEWVFKQMHALTDHRLREMLPTIVTSNHDPDRLHEHIGAPAASRVLQICRPLHLPGADRRRPKPSTTDSGRE